jgi:FtsP/CotA-like multicopper oxidase with cupredoxin domain
MFKTSKYKCHQLGLIPDWKRFILAAFISVLMMILSVPSVQAAPIESILKNPPILQLIPTPAESIKENTSTDENIVENPPVLQPSEEVIPSTEYTTVERSSGLGGATKDENLDLIIEYIKSELYNPITGQDDKVELRGYSVKSSGSQKTYVAPTIEAKPGQTVRVNLDNQLPQEGVNTCPDPVTDVNNPHCFNSTNLHSHGLWVSPTGNSDNVLLSIKPGVKFQYEYNIPVDHPAGTFWYHPHRHGSTGIQVGSGMAGAFIVRGDRLPKQEGNTITHGDIDTLLEKAGIKFDPTKPPKEQYVNERILVLQQIPYACKQNCQDNDFGQVESYDVFKNWLKSGRYTSINGEILPDFEGAEVGKIERWRIIHGGVNETINLQFKKLQQEAPDIKDLRGDDVTNYGKNHCTGNAIDYHVIAEDGLTREQAWKTIEKTLQPGYRIDALMVFPESGKYCVLDASTPAGGSVSGAEKSRLLGFVEVKAGTINGSISDYLKGKLVEAANKLEVSETVKKNVEKDLNNNLLLTLFTPHTSLLGIEDKNFGTQELAFNISGGFLVSNKIDGTGLKPYDPHVIDRTLELGKIDQWTLMSRGGGGHPFHIHVNPFQIVEIRDPKNHDVTDPATPDADGDPEYKGLKGVWKDTLWLKAPKDGKFYTIVLRTKYDRYIGQFVIHCHILPHEDQGMMQNVEIVLPGSTTAGHN